jgi:hypothetical protein
MRGETDRAKIDAFMTALAEHVKGTGRIYFTGGGTAVLHGWRDTTIDLDLKADPEPRGFFEVAALKEKIDLNIELFHSIEPELIRYPAVDPSLLRSAVLAAIE